MLCTLHYLNINDDDDDGGGGDGDDDVLMIYHSTHTLRLVGFFFVHIFYGHICASSE